MERISMNEWTVTGEVFYLKKLEGEFSASVKVRGVAKREDVYSSQMLEIGCLLSDRVYREGVRKGLKLHGYCTLSGHLESWVKTKPNGTTNSKVMFIADYVLSA